MALGTPTHLGQGSAVGGPATSSAFTPAASVQLFCQVVSRKNTASEVASATLEDSEGGTWTERSNLVNTAAQSVRQQIFTKMSVASPVEITVTATSTGSTDCIINVDSISGASTDFSNVKAAINANGDPAPTLDSSPASTSKPLVWFGARNISGNATNAPTNYTHLLESSISGIKWASSYFSGTPPASAAVAWSTFQGLAVGTILEVKEGATAFTGTGAGVIAPLTGDGVGVVTEVFVGTGAGVTAPLTGVGVGTEVFVGTGAGALTALTGVGVGQEVFVGTGAGVTAPLTGTGTGKEVFVGTASSTLVSVNGIGAGTHGVTGVGSGVLNQLTGNAIGLEVFAGTGAGTVQSISGVGVGEYVALGDIVGSATGTLDQLTGFASGSFTLGTIVGTGAGVLDQLTGNAIGLEVFAGTGAGSVISVSGTGTGAFTSLDEIVGFGAGTLAQLNGIASGSFTLGAIVGAGAGTLAQLTGVGSGLEVWTGIGSGLLPNLTGNAVGKHGVAGVGSGIMLSLTGNGVGLASAAGTEFLHIGGVTVPVGNVAQGMFVGSERCLFVAMGSTVIWGEGP